MIFVINTVQIYSQRVCDKWCMSRRHTTMQVVQEKKSSQHYYEIRFLFQFLQLSDIDKKYCPQIRG